MLSLSTVRVRDPFGDPNFLREIGRISWYVNCIWQCGIRWLGFRFHFPVIWFLLDHYHLRINYHRKKNLIGGMRSSIHMGKGLLDMICMILIPLMKFMKDVKSRILT